MRGVEERLRRLAEDRRSGASALAREAAAILALAARGGADAAALRRLGGRLVRALPAMVPLRWAVGWTLRGLEDGGRLAEAVPRRAREYAEESRRRAEGAARAAAAALRGARAVLTHSRSATVLAALLALDPRRTRAIVCESRPRLEGRAVARALAARGFRAELIVDAAAALLVPEADAILVGADAVLRDGSVVNKAGTRALALLAREAGVPFYAVAETFKFDPRPPSEARFEEMDPAEVLPRAVPGVRARNPYFDRTPARDVTAILTERGRVAPSDAGSIAREGRGWFGLETAAAGRRVEPRLLRRPGQEQRRGGGR